MSNDDRLDDTVRIAAHEIGAIELRSIDSAMLHPRAETGPVPVPDLSDIKYRARRWYVLDYAQKRVLVLDSAGGVVDSVGSSIVPRMVSPVRVDFAAETLLVLDTGSQADIRAFAPDGGEVPFQGVAHTGTASDLVMLDAGAMLAFRPTSKLKQKRTAVFIPAAGGTPIWSCPTDRRHRGSDTPGMLSIYGYTTLGAGVAGRIACVQVISPVVSVFDPNTSKTSFVTALPPEYRSPREQPVNLNAKRMAAYVSSWTPHQSAYPTAAGVLSVFELTEKGRGLEYLLFACDSVTGPMRCGSRRIYAKLVRFVAPDTLLVARIADGLILQRMQVTRWH